MTYDNVSRWCNNSIVEHSFVKEHTTLVFAVNSRKVQEVLTLARDTFQLTGSKLVTCQCAPTLLWEHSTTC
jgi:hypothetical protein